MSRGSALAIGNSIYLHMVGNSQSENYKHTHLHNTQDFIVICNSKMSIKVMSSLM